MKLLKFVVFFRPNESEAIIGYFYVFLVHLDPNKIPIQIPASHSNRRDSSERIEYGSGLRTIVLDEPFHEGDRLLVRMNKRGRAHSRNRYQGLRTLSMEREPSLRCEDGDFVAESRATLQIPSSVRHLVPYDFGFHFHSR